MKRLRRPTYAESVATLALFLVLAGGSAIALNGKNSVDSGDIKNRQVKSQDLARNAVKAERPRRVKPNPQVASDPCENGKTGVFCGYFNDGPSDGYWSNVPLEGYWDDRVGPTAFFKDRSGIVHLSGIVAPNSFQTTLHAFLLPRAYRPAATRVIPTICASSGPIGDDDAFETCMVLIRANGQVTRGQSPTPFGGMTLDGISFRAK